MDLIVRNKLISADLTTILKNLRKDLNDGRLKQISPKGDNIAITCPFHKNGHEARASCFVFNNRTDPDTEWGKVHCFTCGYTGGLIKFISDCFSVTKDVAEDYICDRYADTFIKSETFLPEISFDNKETKEYLKEDILKEFDYYHPYMWQRKLSKEIVDAFRIGYDQKNKCVTFPVWDEKNHLVMITKRSVLNKQFFIPSGVEKPVYLLNFVKRWNIDTAIVCEGQIDALVAWTYGFPAIALFGAGTTKQQIEILNKSGIFHFILMYDNDAAGRHGAERFKKLISKDRLVTDIIMPVDKDIADCSKEEFDEILSRNGILSRA